MKVLRKFYLTYHKLNGGANGFIFLFKKFLIGFLMFLYQKIVSFKIGFWVGNLLSYI